MILTITKNNNRLELKHSNYNISSIEVLPDNISINDSLVKSSTPNPYSSVIKKITNDMHGAIIYDEEDWCVSSIAYYDVKYENKNAWFMHLINFLFRDKEHCKVSFETEYKELGRYPK